MLQPVSDEEKLDLLIRTGDYEAYSLREIQDYADRYLTIRDEIRLRRYQFKKGTITREEFYRSILTLTLQVVTDDLKQENHLEQLTALRQQQ